MKFAEKNKTEFNKDIYQVPRCAGQLLQSWYFSQNNLNIELNLYKKKN